MLHSSRITISQKSLTMHFERYYNISYPTVMEIYNGGMFHAFLVLFSHDDGYKKKNSCNRKNDMLKLQASSCIVVNCKYFLMYL